MTHCQLQEYLETVNDAASLLPPSEGRSEQSARFGLINEMILARNAHHDFPVTAVASNRSFDGGLVGWDGWLVYLIEQAEAEGDRRRSQDSSLLYE